ncbi:hypothetical protein HAX54_009539 [Datura stramonium]|uniref:Cytochrome P450 n=1 Tax=Datura stramonium TaxID=4076 RepID=A0ABS8RY48_DATST|nr:hypothetical protein [Datura stramonium]
MDLLSRLLIAGHEDEMVRDMVISFLMAGRDTTSSALTWLFWLTTNHPDVKNQMIDEITSINSSNKALRQDKGSKNPIELLISVRNGSDGGDLGKDRLEFKPDRWIDAENGALKKYECV